MKHKTLTSSLIKKAFLLLGEKAKAKGIKAEITIYGGAVMMIAFDARESTRDVDAIFRPREEIKALAEEVASELDLSSEWLNDDVKMWVGENEQRAKIEFADLETPGLRITRPTAKYLLAMKARAARLPGFGQQGDFDDLVKLITHTQIQTVEEIEKIVGRYFLGDTLPDRNVEVLKIALQKAHHHEPNKPNDSASNH